jgi:hypothetical protein
MQVVTNENMAEFIQNRAVPDFVPPKADAKVEVTVEPAKEEVKEPARGEDGKFVKADEVKDEAAKAADDSDDPDDADLPERVRKQIGKKHRAMREAEEFAREMRADREAERERADRAEAALKAATQKSGPTTEKDAKAPNPEDFKTNAEYIEAYADWKVEKKLAERDARQVQERQETAARAAQAELNQRIAATVKELPDYAEVIADSDIDLAPHMAVYIAESPVGPHIGYWLAKDENRAEYDRLSKLSPTRAIAELGKLEDRKPWVKKVEAKEPDAEPKAVSRAPSPITPLEGKSAPSTKDPAKMTIQELREYERAKTLERARR